MNDHLFSLYLKKISPLWVDIEIHNLSSKYNSDKYARYSKIIKFATVASAIITAISSPLSNESITSIPSGSLISQWSTFSAAILTILLTSIPLSKFDYTQKSNQEWTKSRSLEILARKLYDFSISVGSGKVDQENIDLTILSIQSEIDKHMENRIDKYNRFKEQAKKNYIKHDISTLQYQEIELVDEFLSEEAVAGITVVTP